MSRHISTLGVTGLALAALLVVAAPATAKTKTKTDTFSQCRDVGFPLLDSSSHNVTFDVPVPKRGKKAQRGAVTNVTTAVRITHTHAEDLVLYLVSPSGTVVPLSIGRGESGDGFGTGPATCGGTLAHFGDAFTTPIAASGTVPDEPVVGFFKPELPLATFNGGAARGAWTVVVGDATGGDVGALNSASLNVTYEYKKETKKKDK